MDVNETVTLTLTTEALSLALLRFKVTVKIRIENNDVFDETEVEKDFVIVINDDSKHLNVSPVKAMHATGNPIIIVLLAFLAVCGVGLRKRF